MSKKIKLLVAVLMSLTTIFATAACDMVVEIPGPGLSEILESESAERESANQSSEEESSEEESSEEESSEVESSEESSVGDETDNEVGPKALVATATAEQIADYNATGIKLYDITNFSEVEGASVALETAYIFSVTETVEEAKASEYANWIADYYVSVDSAVEAGKIGLAGSYDGWANGDWVAFYSPVDVEANQQIGLLESTDGTPWTYADIVEFVGTFRCGAFDLDGACAGVTLKVELRLTNPEDATDVISVCVTEYTFA